MLSIVVFTWLPLPNQKESIPSQKIIKYGESHVNTHYRMISDNLNIPFNYFLFTDNISGHYNSNIKVCKLWDYCRPLGGCYNRLFSFSKDMLPLVGDRAIYMDLDMIITGDITRLLDRDEDFVYYKMRNASGPGQRMNNGMYMMTTGSRDFIWEEFISDPQQAINMRKGAGTDQGWTNYRLDLENEAHWTQGVDGIYDMRQDIIFGKGVLPENCKILMWPGPRDPSQKHWRKKYKFIEEYYY
jgi:hypothetical protein